MLSADTPGAAGSQAHDGLPEAGQALEVIEMANGETIWYELSVTDFCRRTRF